MTDLEITRLCAEAMGATEIGSNDKYGIICRIEKLGYGVFNPLHDDAQAMALAKKFTPDMVHEEIWCVDKENGSGRSPDLNRAICECVAKMQKSK